MVYDFVAESFNLPNVIYQAYHWVGWVIESFAYWSTIFIKFSNKWRISILYSSFSHQLFPSLLDIVLGLQRMLLVFDVAHSQLHLQPGFSYKASADLVK